MSRPDGEAPPVVVRTATPADLAHVRALVSGAGLPLDGLVDADVVLVAERGGVVVGTAALERHGAGSDAAFLLRSVAVAPDVRDGGVGTALTTEALARADAVGAPVGLLTETAQQWFPRFGFVPVSRDLLPPSLAGSAELRGACPDSAQALLRQPSRRCGPDAGSDR